MTGDDRSIYVNLRSLCQSTFRLLSPREICVIWRDQHPKYAQSGKIQHCRLNSASVCLTVSCNTNRFVHCMPSFECCARIRCLGTVPWRFHSESGSKFNNLWISLLVICPGEESRGVRFWNWRWLFIIYRLVQAPVAEAWNFVAIDTVFGQYLNRLCVLSQFSGQLFIRNLYRVLGIDRIETYDNNRRYRDRNLDCLRTLVK